MTQNETESETQIFLIDPHELHPNPVNVDIYGEEEVDLELVESIKELGQLDPIVITDDKTIISGHRRWVALMALKDLGIKAKCLYKHFKTKLEEKEAIIECNRQREKTWMQTCNEVELLKEIYAERAEQRRLVNLKQNANKNTEVPNSASRSEFGSTRDYIEKKSGVKHDKLSKMNLIITKVKAGDEIAVELEKKGKAGLITVDAAVKTLKIDEIAKSDSTVAGKAKVVRDQVMRGDITPNKGVQQINAEMKAEKEKAKAQATKTAKIPQGIFNVIVSDTYPIEDIMHKRIPADEDSVLFLWSSASSLPESLELMEFWDFEYKSMAILDKGITGSGSLVLASYDVLLVGTCGTGVLPASKLPGVIHEKKRDCIYEIIEQMFPGQKYLELFKENKREGWNVGQVEEAPQQPQQEPEPEPHTDDTPSDDNIEKESLEAPQQPQPEPKPAPETQTTEIESQEPPKSEKASRPEPQEPEKELESHQESQPQPEHVQEPVKEEPDQEPVKEKPIKVKVQKAKKDVKPKEKTTSEEKKAKQNYIQYDTQIQTCVAGKSLSRLEIIEAIGLKDLYESLDKKGKHAMEEGISKRCKALVAKGILIVDEITSKEKGSAHYIAKTQS